MDSERWQRIQTLFHDAADLSSEKQKQFLEEACGDDATLVADVLALLEEDARGSSLLDHDVAHVADAMFGSVTLPYKEFGPYRIREALGEGGMGAVYLAERQDLHSLVAIKLLRDAWLSPARRERFASEQRMLAQLNHPGIARLYDADTLPDGTPWFVMEYVEGAPLTEYCARHASPLRQRLELLRAVCEAVQYAHSSAVIHRDLKPSNILVKEDGSVRLLDFGIAKQMESLIEDAPQQSPATMTGLRLMTPAYAAPEQVRGERVGVHTDVYSLGVILYELLTGRLPFDLSRRTPAEAEQVIVSQEPEKPSAVARRAQSQHPHPSPKEGERVGHPQLGSPGGERVGQSGLLAVSAGKTEWADLDVLCLTAMHKDAQRRYRSVEALVRDLDHFLRGEPLEARPDTLGYRAGKFVRRNRNAVAATSLVLVATIALVTFFTVRLARARNEALAEAARAERTQHFVLNLFQGGDEAAGPADSLRVISLLDRGVQEAQALGRDPAAQADLYQTLGTIYQKLGKFDRADSLLNSALDERKRLYGADSAEVAETTVLIGLLRADQAQLPQAEQLVRDGLAMAKRHLPPNHPAIARADDALGKVLEERGSYDQAIAVLEEAVRLHSTGGNVTPELAESLMHLGNNHFYAGHYQVFDSITHRVLDMHKQLYGERHPSVADDLINLGAVQHEQGNYVLAEKYFRQALDINLAYYGKDHYKTASSLTQIGRSLVFQNRFDEATAVLTEALGIQERVFGKVHPKVASALNDLGNAASKQGKYAAAEQYFTRVRDIYRTVYNGKHYVIGIATANLASVYLAEKDYKRAEALFREALQMYAQTLSEGHLNVGITRIKLGRTLLREGRVGEAERESKLGYEIVSRQTLPTVTWLQNARQDLIDEYDALKQHEQAQHFRDELAKTTATLAAKK
jgi:eukaryotic-like serine/threonine-protein kinase